MFCNGMRCSQNNSWKFAAAPPGSQSKISHSKKLKQRCKPVKFEGCMTWSSSLLKFYKLRDVHITGGAVYCSVTTFIQILICHF